MGPSSRPRPRIGLLPTGHDYYWDQFPHLKAMGEAMLGKLRALLEGFGEVVAPELVDTEEKARQAGDLFLREAVDLVLVFPLGYTPGMRLLPAVRNVSVPIRLLSVHEDRSYDYAAADTAQYLHHEGVCCIPEFAGALVSMDRRFRVRTGYLEDPRLQAELETECRGAAAAAQFRRMNVGLIGETYTNMADMPIDEHRLLRATGRLLVRPEVEEVLQAFQAATDEQVGSMLREFRELYDVDGTVTDEHMRFSAQVAVAFDEVVSRHDLSAFGYYWWGQTELVTQLRAQSNIAVSRLAALGRPGVTEGDVKTAIAMKLLDLLGAGGMFVEFFSMDFDESFLLMGHDGPCNISMAEGPPRLQHLPIHHGKSGHGLGLDFRLREGPVTLLNLTQFDAGETFKLIVSVGEIITGPTLQIGNPNCRVRPSRPLPEFIDAWCQQGPSHHLALGYGDQSQALQTLGEALGFQVVTV